MGDIAVGQTKRVRVVADGTELSPSGFVATGTPGVNVFETGDQTQYDVTGVAAGPFTISVEGANAYAGRSGSFSGTVDDAPLTVDLVDL